MWPTALPVTPYKGVTVKISKRHGAGLRGLNGESCDTNAELCNHTIIIIIIILSNQSKLRNAQIQTNYR